MRSFNGRTIANRESRYNDKIKVGGREFHLDTAFRRYWHTVQMATVQTADRDDLRSGDIIWVHHFVEDQSLPWGENISFVEYNQVYCRMRDGIIDTLGNFVLVEPITYGEIGTTKKDAGFITSMKRDEDNADRIGVVRLLSQRAKEFGLKDGDRVLFNKNCEYEILVDGKLYYRMELMDIICTIDDDVKIKV